MLDKFRKKHDPVMPAETSEEVAEYARRYIDSGVQQAANLAIVNYPVEREYEWATDEEPLQTKDTETIETSCDEELGVFPETAGG